MVDTNFSDDFPEIFPRVAKYKSSDWTVWINPALPPQALPVRVKGSQTPTDRKRSPTHRAKAVISYSSSEQDMRVSKVSQCSNSHALHCWLMPMELTKSWENDRALAAVDTLDLLHT